jgi:hypothetical protein
VQRSERPSEDRFIQRAARSRTHDAELIATRLGMALLATRIDTR